MRRGSQEDKQIVIDILVSAFISNNEMNSINYIVNKTNLEKRECKF